MVSWDDLLIRWQLHPLAGLAIAAAGLLYALGVKDLARRGRRWAPARTVAFCGALAAAVLATQSGVSRYEHDRFTVHMAQHVLLGLVVPLLVVLSAPLTLALQTAPATARQLLRSALHSTGGRLLAHPMAGWSLFGGGLVVLYLTPLLDLAAHDRIVHMAVHAHIVVAGVLFLTPLLGIDTLPRRIPHGARLLVLLLAVPFHTVVAMAMISATAPVAPETYPLLDDQRRAAAIFWVTGELFTLCAAAVVLRQWWTAEQRAAARELSNP